MIPDNIKSLIKLVPITETISLYDNEELDAEEVLDEVAAVPEFIFGTEASYIISPTQGHVLVGGEEIFCFESAENAWESACYDAADELRLPHTEESYRLPKVITRASRLIKTKSWWSW